MAAATPTSGAHRVSPVFLTLLGVTGAAGWGVWTGFSASTGFAVFLFVTAGWVVSLCLHEYAHARTALHGGDASVAAKGYLTLNPLRYTHPLLSIGLPVLFVVLGGIGLPGGAVFVERGRIPGRWRHSLVSAAGPLTNGVLAVLLTAPFWLGALDGVPAPFRYALGFLALLQVTAAVVNSLPVPGLDGYGVVEPWLPPGVRRRIEPFAPFGLLAVFGLLWGVPEAGRALFSAVQALLGALGVPGWDAFLGLEHFRFWDGEPTLPTR